MIKNGAALTDQAAEPVMRQSLAGAHPISRKPPQKQNKHHKK
jgi:hypothetical protein